MVELLKRIEYPGKTTFLLEVFSTKNAASKR